MDSANVSTRSGSSNHATSFSESHGYQGSLKRKRVSDEVRSERSLLKVGKTKFIKIYFDKFRQTVALKRTWPSLPSTCMDVILSWRISVMMTLRSDTGRLKPLRKIKKSSTSFMSVKRFDRDRQ